MIIVIPILQMRESRFRVIKYFLRISSGGRVGFRSTSFWLRILFLAIVHLSHVEMSPNHMALKSIHMINESQIYISNIDLPPSSRLKYPTAYQYLKLNLPQSEFQTTFSLHKVCSYSVFTPLCKFVSIQLLRPKCDSHPWGLFFFHSPYASHQQIQWD